VGFDNPLAVTVMFPPFHNPAVLFCLFNTNGFGGGGWGDEDAPPPALCGTNCGLFQYIVFS
jgi:hypothetical protein